MGAPPADACAPSVVPGSGDAGSSSAVPPPPPPFAPPGSSGRAGVPFENRYLTSTYLSHDYLTDQLNKLPVGRLYPELCAKIVDILVNRWSTRFSPSVWSKFLKKTQSPVPRILKEVNEIAPVLDRVLRFVEADRKRENAERSDPRFTIVDLGSGLGFMGLLLPELIEDVERVVKDIFLVDKMWRKGASNGEPSTKEDSSTKEAESQGKEASSSGKQESPRGEDGPSTREEALGTRGGEPSTREEQARETSGGAPRAGDREARREGAGDGLDHVHMSTEHILQAKRFIPVPLATLQLDLKRGRDLADLKHFIFENGKKENRGSGNIANVPSGDARHSSVQKNPAHLKNRVILLGVHLCGSLSLRTADLVNQNPETVEFACIKPCCLPGKLHLRHQVTYRVGSFEFTAEELYGSGTAAPRDAAAGGEAAAREDGAAPGAAAAGDCPEAPEPSQAVPSEAQEDDNSWVPVAEAAILDAGTSDTESRGVVLFQNGGTCEQSAWRHLPPHLFHFEKALDNSEVYQHLEKLRRQEENPEMRNWEENDDGAEGVRAEGSKKRAPPRNKAKTNSSPSRGKVFLISGRTNTLRVMERGGPGGAFQEVPAPRRGIDGAWLLRAPPAGERAEGEPAAGTGVFVLLQGGGKLEEAWEPLGQALSSCLDRAPQLHGCAAPACEPSGPLPEGILSRLGAISAASGDRWEGKARFKRWCGYVEESIRVNDREYCEVADDRLEADSKISHEIIMVAPQYFQNRFIFVERQARKEKPRDYGDDYTNQILIPHWEMKEGWREKLRESRRKQREG